MDNIIVAYQPFTRQQNIFVYKDNEMKETLTVDLDKVNDTIVGLANQYCIHDITLAGNQDYLNRFKAELNTRFADTGFNVRITNK